jgi:ubiquinone/menaquinone biosynthesis C-methylase UbiE
MIAVARQRSPALDFRVGSMLRLPAPDDAWAGILSMYSIIHLTTGDRSGAFREFARVLCAGGWRLLAFHVNSPEFSTGDVNRITDWFGTQVELDGHFLDPGPVTDELLAAGMTIVPHGP